MPAHYRPDVPLARPGPITDPVLAEIGRHSIELQNGQCTHEGGALISMCLPALIEELQSRREVMRHIGRVASADVIEIETFRE